MPNLCEICDEEPAVVHCQECDLDLCNQNNCNRQIHDAPGKRNHTRVPITGGGGGAKTGVICDLCDEGDAEVHCKECNMNLCNENSCNDDMHQGDKRRHHREPIPKKSKTSQSKSRSSKTRNNRTPVLGGRNQPQGKLCDLCEKSTAVVFCEACDFYLCHENNCDYDMHSQPGKRNHQRVPVDSDGTPARQQNQPYGMQRKQSNSSIRSPPPPTSSKQCNLCEEDNADIYCEDCEFYLCTANNCDNDIHRPPIMKDHRRRRVDGQPMNSQQSPMSNNNKSRNQSPLSRGPSRTPSVENIYKNNSPSLKSNPRRRSVVPPPLNRTNSFQRGALGNRQPSPGLQRQNSMSRNNSYTNNAYTDNNRGYNNQRNQRPTLSRQNSRYSRNSITSPSQQQYSPYAEPASLLPTCDLCEDQQATIWCAECSMNLCLTNKCDDDMHKPDKFKVHIRQKLRSDGTPGEALRNPYAEAAAQEEEIRKMSEQRQQQRAMPGMGGMGGMGGRKRNPGGRRESVARTQLMNLLRRSSSAQLPQTAAPGSSLLNNIQKYMPKPGTAGIQEEPSGRGVPQEMLNADGSTTVNLRDDSSDEGNGEMTELQDRIKQLESSINEKTNSSGDMAKINDLHALVNKLKEENEKKQEEEEYKKLQEKLKTMEENLSTQRETMSKEIKDEQQAQQTQFEGKLESLSSQLTDLRTLSEEQGASTSQDLKDQMDAIMKEMKMLKTDNLSSQVEALQKVQSATAENEKKIEARLSVFQGREEKNAEELTRKLNSLQSQMSLLKERTDEHPEMVTSLAKDTHEMMTQVSSLVSEFTALKSGKSSITVAGQEQIRAQMERLNAELKILKNKTPDIIPALAEDSHRMQGHLEKLTTELLEIKKSQPRQTREMQKQLVALNEQIRSVKDDQSSTEVLERLASELNDIKAGKTKIAIQEPKELVKNMESKLSQVTVELEKTKRMLDLQAEQSHHEMMKQAEHSAEEMRKQAEQAAAEMKERAEERQEELKRQAEKQQAEMLKQISVLSENLNGIKQNKAEQEKAREIAQERHDKEKSMLMDKITQLTTQMTEMQNVYKSQDEHEKLAQEKQEEEKELLLSKIGDLTCNLTEMKSNYQLSQPKQRDFLQKQMKDFVSEQNHTIKMQFETLMSAATASNERKQALGETARELADELKTVYVKSEELIRQREEQEKRMEERTEKEKEKERKRMLASAKRDEELEREAQARGLRFAIDEASKVRTADGRLVGDNHVAIPTVDPDTSDISSVSDSTVGEEDSDEDDSSSDSDSSSSSSSSSSGEEQTEDEKEKERKGEKEAEVELAEAKDKESLLREAQNALSNVDEENMTPQELVTHLRSIRQQLKERLRQPKYTKEALKKRMHVTQDRTKNGPAGDVSDVKSDAGTLTASVDKKAEKKERKKERKKRRKALRKMRKQAEEGVVGEGVLMEGKARDSGKAIYMNRLHGGQTLEAWAPRGRTSETHAQDERKAEREQRKKWKEQKTREERERKKSRQDRKARKRRKKRAAMLQAHRQRTEPRDMVLMISDREEVLYNKRNSRSKGGKYHTDHSDALLAPTLEGPNGRKMIESTSKTAVARDRREKALHRRRHRDEHPPVHDTSHQHRERRRKRSNDTGIGRGRHRERERVSKGRERKRAEATERHAEKRSRQRPGVDGRHDSQAPDHRGRRAHAKSRPKRAATPQETIDRYWLKSHEEAGQRIRMYGSQKGKRKSKDKGKGKGKDEGKGKGKLGSKIAKQGQTSVGSGVGEGKIKNKSKSKRTAVLSGSSTARPLSTTRIRSDDSSGRTTLSRSSSPFPSRVPTANYHATHSQAHAHFGTHQRPHSARPTPASAATQPWDSFSAAPSFRNTQRMQTPAFLNDGRAAASTPATPFAMHSPVPPSSALSPSLDAGPAFPLTPAPPRAHSSNAVLSSPRTQRVTDSHNHSQNYYPSYPHFQPFVSASKHMPPPRALPAHHTHTLHPKQQLHHQYSNNPRPPPPSGYYY